MKKHQHNFNVAFPQSVNADHQAVEVIHKEVDPMDGIGMISDPWESSPQDTGER